TSAAEAATHRVCNAALKRCSTLKSQCLLTLNRMRHLSWRWISFDRGQKFSRQALTQFFIAAARKIVPQVFLGRPFVEVSAQQAFDRVRHFAGHAAIPDRTRDRLMQANGAAHTKVIGVLLAAI